MPILFWLHKRQGLSTIELLTVCGIISIFSAIILPCFFLVRSNAQSVVCKSNLRQLGTGFSLHAQQNGGKLPHADRDSDTGPNHCWFDLMDHYLQVENLHTIKQCPAWKGYNPNGITEDLHSLKMNGGLCPKERLPEKPEEIARNFWYWPRNWRIKSQSNTVLLVDGRMDSPLDTHTDTEIVQPYNDVANRHSGGCNILFVDGSIQYINAENQGIAKGKIGWSSDAGLIWTLHK